MNAAMFGINRHTDRGLKKIAKPDQMNSENYEILTGALQHTSRYLHKIWVNRSCVGYETTAVQTRNRTKTQSNEPQPSSNFEYAK